MKEFVLYKYFLDEVSENELAIDLNGSQEKTGYDTIAVNVERIGEDEFEITAEHLIKVCDAYLSGSLKEIDLNTIGFALQASEYFTWENNSKSGKIVSEVISDWDNENIGYDITQKNVWHWKRYLETGFINLDKHELDLKFRSKGKYLDLYRKIDCILETEWDPIGVSALVRDEYQSYVPQIFRMKISNKQAQEIEDELYSLETDIIGALGNRGNCKRVSELISELELKSDT